ncbi:Hypothetical protein PHPALM_16846 [Phytophthora palmivora]|uniref:Uncharacterized protein n=1 Tax=Phytophthora palmivora TaxID=4796 RepID=A0A2P4XNS3_9STRA|nr:Hypothetical protein PHPALM_16846 [Phytophthora palmivora]
MAPTTRNQTQDDPPGEEGNQAELEAQIAQLRAQIATLQAMDQAARAPSVETKPRVSTGFTKFKGNAMKTYANGSLCRIHGHDATNDNPTLPASTGTAMEESASGWFLFWAPRTLPEQQTWGQLTIEPSRTLNLPTTKRCCGRNFGVQRQVLIFRIENMSEVDQVSYYYYEPKHAT